MISSLYPLSPTINKSDITKLSKAYKRNVFYAAFSVFLFFLLYISLITLLIYTIIYHFFIATVPNTFAFVWVILSLFFLVFILKFAFKFKKKAPDKRLFIDKKSHQTLFEFVEQIAREIGVETPEKIYIDIRVNASVTYSRPWLSLIMPVKKELTLGLPLIDTLNLSELKAVVAHEFGHFSQKSMRIGSYVNSANRVIHDMIFTRDAFDEALAKMGSFDFRLLIFGWLAIGLLWVVRQVLNLFYLLLNFTNAKMSREMEFHADKVAVSVSGSDAIVNSLWKLPLTDDAYNVLIYELSSAAEHKLILKNVFEYFSRVNEEFIQKVHSEKGDFEVDPRGGKKTFTDENSRLSGMYAHHPSNESRESNAKTPYITCSIDERSSWLLFEDKESLQEQVSVQLYSLLGVKSNGNFTDLDTFKQFTETEKLEQEKLEQVGDTFKDRRFLIPDSFDNHIDVTKETMELKLREIESNLSELMKPITEIETAMREIVAVVNKTSKAKSVVYKNTTYKKKVFWPLHAKLKEIREETFFKIYSEWDRDLCLFYLSIARQTGQYAKLSDYYQQHRQVYRFTSHIQECKNNIIIKINELNEKRSYFDSEEHIVSNLIDRLIIGLNEKFGEFDNIKFMPLSNIHTQQALKELLLPNGKFERLPGNLFECFRFEKFMEQLDNSIMNSWKIEQKSFAHILELHDELKIQFMGNN